MSIHRTLLERCTMLLRASLLATFVLVATALLSSESRAVTVYSEAFSAGTVPGGWTAQDGTMGTATLGVADDSGGIGSGNALSISSATRQGVIGMFGGAALANLGDTVALTFDARLDAVPDNSGGFRFGLMQSEAADNSHGYRISVGTGANTPYTSANADGGDADILFGVNRDILRIDDDASDTGGIADALSHSFELRLTLVQVGVENGVSIRVIQDGQDSLSPQAVVHLASEPAGGAPGSQVAQPLQLTYDQIAFSTNGGITGFIDNVEVTHTPLTDKRRLIVNREDGSVTLYNPSAAGGALSILGYSLTSDAGALDQTGWNKVADHYDASGLPADQIDTDDEWVVLTDPSSFEDFSEFEPDGDGGVIALDGSLSLSDGGAWVPSPTEDLQMELLLTDGSTELIEVYYEGNSGLSFVLGDLDFDGDLDADDYVILRDNGLTDLSSFSPAQAYGLGDLNGDGVNDLRDYTLLRTAFDEIGQAQAFFAAELAYGSQAPEPNSLALVLLSFCAVLGGWRRLARRVLSSVALPAFAVALLLTVGGEAQAVVSGFTGSTFDSDLDNNGDVVDTAILTSYTTTHGTVTDLATAVTGFGSFDLTGANEVRNTWGVDGAEIDGAAAVLNLDFSTGLLNSGDVSDTSSVQVDASGTPISTGEGGPMFFMYSMDVSAGLTGAANDFFIVENGGNDTVTIKPIDSAGSPIGDFELNINGGSDWGASFTGGAGYARVGDAVSAGTVANFGGLAFDVEDFTGTGTLSGMMGISIEGASGLDALIIGVNSQLAPPPPPELLTAEVNLVNGRITIKNNSFESIEFSSYQLTSTDNPAFDLSGWKSLDFQNVDPVDGDDPGIDLGDGPGESWDEVGGASNSTLAEHFFLGSTLLESDDTLNLGLAYNETLADDFTFEYFDVAEGVVKVGLIEFVSIEEGLSGDFNGDGVVDSVDYAVWRENLGALDESSLNGNGDMSGVVDDGDFALWLSNYGASLSSSTSAEATPEPGALAGLAGVAAVLAFRRRRTVDVPAVD